MEQPEIETRVGEQGRGHRMKPKQRGGRRQRLQELWLERAPMTSVVKGREAPGKQDAPQGPIPEPTMKSAVTLGKGFKELLKC